MSICLKCGSAAATVWVLWNAASKRDEKFCFQCAAAFKRDHPNDHTPHGAATAFAELKQTPSTTPTLWTPTDAKEVQTYRCEVCGLTTANRQRTAGGFLLCFTCKDAAERRIAATKYVGGVNGITKINNYTSRTWCHQCHKMIDDDLGRKLNSSHYEWWCFDCISLREEGDVCNWHVKMKITGTEEAKAFFHWMMQKLDNDWEGGGPFAAAADEICPHCGGWEWANPRLNPNQVKKLAKLAGLRKLKIQFWGKAQVCNAKSMKEAFNVVQMMEGMVE